ncbi:MAG: TonB-dependent receptor, partial [Methylophagaceae bacterium]
MFKTKALSNAIRYSLLLGSVALAPNALAQENDLNSDVELEEEAPERIVVTGSRIRKAEFSNASPIQIINGDLSREMGLFDAGSMLQSTSQAAGAQIDNTFGGFVLDNGPGAATIGFRGLGAERTLVL